jgi:hypothetical protein
MKNIEDIYNKLGNPAFALQTNIENLRTMGLVNNYSPDYFSIIEEMSRSIEKINKVLYEDTRLKRTLNDLEMDELPTTCHTCNGRKEDRCTVLNGQIEFPICLYCPLWKNILIELKCNLLDNIVELLMSDTDGFLYCNIPWKPSGDYKKPFSWKFEDKWYSGNLLDLFFISIKNGPPKTQEYYAKMKKDGARIEHGYL